MSDFRLALQLTYCSCCRPGLVNSPADTGGVKAVVGPGTGLGVSAMLANGGILPSEAGHVGFAPVDDHEVELLRVLRSRYHRVSAERVLSGPGPPHL